MKKRTTNKWVYGISLLAMVSALSFGCASLVYAEETEASVVGKWCVTGGHSTETIEFQEDGKMNLLSADGFSINGTYEVDAENQVLDFVLEDPTSKQKSEGSLYWKANGDHLAMVEDEGPMELNIMTAYYTKKDAADDYETEADIEGIAAKAWTVKSGVDTIEIGGKEYQANKMYFVFGMNLLQIGEPDNMGDPYYEKMMYAPYEYGKRCKEIYFFFNQPFSDDIGVKYDLKLKKDELILTAEDGSEIVFEAVDVKEAE